MKRILEEKKKYNEIEIPQELSSRVSAAIGQSKPKKGAGFYIKVLAAPVAVCAAICVAIGINGLPDDVPAKEETTETDTVVAGGGNAAVPRTANAIPDDAAPVATPEAAKNARMSPVEDVCQPTSGTARMNEEVEKNNASVIYTDGEYISLFRVDEHGTKCYLNFTQIDGKDVYPEDFGIEGYDVGTSFYISSYDTVVLVVDGTEKEIKISR